MQRITLSQAKPGMVLAEPASSEQGTTVCGPGTELTETLITRLGRFGVSRITVEGHPVPKKGEDKSLTQLTKELDVRFSRVQDNPLMMELKAVFREQLHDRMQQRGAPDDAIVPDADAGSGD